MLQAQAARLLVLCGGDRFTPQPDGTTTAAEPASVCCAADRVASHVCAVGCSDSVVDLAGGIMPMAPQVLTTS